MKEKFEWFVIIGIVYTISLMYVYINFIQRDDICSYPVKFTIPNQKLFVEKSVEQDNKQVIESQDIVDTVYYRDLDTNKQYIVKGWVIDEKTKETIGCSEIIFCPKKPDGYIDAVVTIKNTYIGQTLVLYTSLEEKK